MASVRSPRTSTQAAYPDANSGMRRLLDGLAPGARVPAERTLVAQLGSSRSTIRHVLSVLEAEGRIERHVGRGTFVSSGIHGSHPTVSPVDIIGARMALEPSMLSLAVSAATPADLSELRRCVEKGARAMNHEEFESWDCAFHRSLAMATHNAVILDLYAHIEQGRQHPTWGGLKRRAFTRELQDIYTEEHSRIVEALTERDAEAAQSAMRTHLLRVRDSLLVMHR